MNKCAEPLTCATASNAEMNPLTLQGLQEAVREIRQQPPFLGWNRVESPFLPEGVVMLESEKQLAIYKEGKVAVANKHDLLRMLTPRFSR